MISDSRVTVWQHIASTLAPRYPLISTHRHVTIWEFLIGIRYRGPGMDRQAYRGSKGEEDRTISLYLLVFWYDHTASLRNR